MSWLLVVCWVLDWLVDRPPIANWNVVFVLPWRCCCRVTNNILLSGWSVFVLRDYLMAQQSIEQERTNKHTRRQSAWSVVGLYDQQKAPMDIHRRPAVPSHWQTDTIRTQTHLRHQIFLLCQQWSCTGEKQRNKPKSSTLSHKPRKKKGPQW